MLTAHANLLTRHQANQALARVGMLAGVEPGVVAAMVAPLGVVEVMRGRTVYRQDDPADGLHIILAGKVKVCRSSADGRENTLEIRGPKEMLGATSIFGLGPHTATATAITDACLSTIDGDTLRTWMSERPQIAERLMRVLAARLRRADSRFLDMMSDDVSGRVAKQLLFLAQRFGTQQGECWWVRHDLTQTEIAQLVGATRESVNKVMCDFAQRGWITTDGKTVLIHYPERLARAMN